MTSYADIMFTPEVEAEQASIGSKGFYTSRYAAKQDEPLGPDEQRFLATRTTLYLASVNSQGWPYLQHRGGPVGFVKMLDAFTIGFADYVGNKQLITKGNLQSDDRVSVFAMDYARKARLKLQGHAKLMAVAEAPESLAERLTTEGQGRVERLMTIRVVAWDWNCPKYITSRFDPTEIAARIGPEMERLEKRNAELEAELAQLREQLGKGQ
ncbi:MAG: pyridoxamine 5'-phosphate oxidase family protein [Pseudomonadota bacterium]